MLQMDIPYRLRPYQHEALHEFFKNKCRGIVQLPTGTGKTIVALYAMKILGVKTAVIVPTIPLAKQWYRKIRRCKIPCGLFYGEEKRLKPITVFVINSAITTGYKYLDNYRFFILDEIHHYASPIFSKLLEKLDGKKVLGLSATVKRLDGRHKLLLQHFPLIYNMTVKQASEKSYVAPIKIIRVEAKMTMEERKEYDKCEETLRKAFIILGTTSIDKIKQLTNTKEKEIALAVLTALVKRRIILSNVEDKKRKVLEICRKHLNEKILLFSESIESIEAIKKYLLKHGVKCQTYHSKTNKKKRERILEGWGKGFNVLLSCRCLEEGIDVPECSVGIIIAGTSSARQMIQRMGRIIRPKPNKTARIYVVYVPRTIEAYQVNQISNIANQKLDKYLNP